MKRQRIKIEGPSTVTSFEAPDSLLERIRNKCDERKIFRNAAIIQALEKWVADAESTVGTKSGANSTIGNASMKYNLHVARNKSQKVVKIMGEIISELSQAAGESIAATPTEYDEDDELMHSIGQQSDEIHRQFADNAKELEEREKAAGTGKPGNGKKISRRSA